MADVDIYISCYTEFGVDKYNNMIDWCSENCGQYKIDWGLSDTPLIKGEDSKADDGYSRKLTYWFKSEDHRLLFKLVWGY